MRLVLASIAYGFSMIDWRLIVPIGLASTPVVACFGYLIASPWRVWPIKPLPSPLVAVVREDVVLSQSVRSQSADEKAVLDFEAAAATILRRAPDARASVLTDVPSPAAKIPLPRR